MSHPGKFVKKHPWEAAGMAAAAGLGGAGLAGMGPLAGMLGAGTAAAETGGPAMLGAGLGGASLGADAAAGLAGGGAEASLYGGAVANAPETALGGSPSGSGINFSGKNLLKGAYYANKASGLLAPQQGPPPGSPPMQSQVPITNTVLPTGMPTQASMEPKTLEELLKRMQMQQQGVA